MKIIFVLRAGESQRFAANAWDDQLGKLVPVRLDGDHVRAGRIVGANVMPDGDAVELTLDITDFVL